MAIQDQHHNLNQGPRYSLSYDEVYGRYPVIQPLKIQLRKPWQQCQQELDLKSIKAEKMDIWKTIGVTLLELIATMVAIVGMVYLFSKK